VGFFSTFVGETGDRNRLPVLTAEEYRAVFESSPDGVLVVCRDGKIRDVNPQVEAMFGYAREELLEEPVEVLVPEAARAAHFEHRSRYARDPHSRPMGVGMELLGRRKDGALFPVEVSLSPWDTPEGQRVVCTVRDITNRRRLRNFSEGAMRASEEERQRIARELHDDTAQRLATLMLHIRLLSMETEPEAWRRGLDHLRDEILETAEGVKRIARGLRPPELEEVGLVTAIRAHLRGLREGGGFEVDAELEPVDHLLGKDAKLALYRVVQEALSNVVRHSGAARARLRLGSADGKVFLVIEDDGRGFTEGQAREGGGGLGLVSMQERAVMVGGRVIVDSTPGEGTRIRINVPASTATEAQNV
jgi:PAS domain S-box-containing protein